MRNSFYEEAKERFLLGVNYWPRRKAMYWWKNFQQEEVEEDFDRICALGLKLVRLFLLWEDFQPFREKVDGQAIDNLIKVLRIAERLGLSILLTLFVGHMSGANWVPFWLIEEKEERSRFPVIVQGKEGRFKVRNLYADKEILDASAYLIQKVGEAVKEEKSLFAYDIANEIDNLLLPTSRQEAKEWVRFIIQRIREVDSAHPITLGLHLKNIEEERGFWPEDLAEFCDFLSMHSYSIYAQWANSPLDGKVAGFTNALIMRMSGKEVWHTEFGICTTSGSSFAGEGYYLATEEQARGYLEQSLEGLYRSGAKAAFFWCYSDYHPSLFHLPPFNKAVYERSFGIFRADASLKPYKQIIKAYTNLPLVRVYALKEIDNQKYYTHPLSSLKEEYKRFR
ncbi:MAG: hypothetical protein DRP75_02635 [Candidatus Omnitrophota bacterium]|nr:MAG: hypothetical protein DRP75_02635 [Candidatus Omnitrophota bacterium]